MKKYKGIAFDFNGTLFFDNDKHKEAWKICAKRFADIELTDKDYFLNIHGKTNSNILKYLFKREATKREVLQYGEEKESMYRTLCLEDKDNIHLTSGAEKLFSQLKEHNFPFIIATSSTIRNLNFYKEIFDLETWFANNDIIYENYTFKGKPNPDIYLLSAQKIGISPSELIVFEDSYSGICAAKQAGAGKIIIVSETEKVDFDCNEYDVIHSFDEFDRDIII